MRLCVKNKNGYTAIHSCTLCSIFQRKKKSKEKTRTYVPQGREKSLRGSWEKYVWEMRAKVCFFESSNFCGLMVFRCEFDVKEWSEFVEPLPWKVPVLIDDCTLLRHQSLSLSMTSCIWSVLLGEICGTQPLPQWMAANGYDKIKEEMIKYCHPLWQVRNQSRNARCEI